MTGTLVLRVFDRKHHRLPLEGTHTVETGDCRWIISPAVTSAERRVRHYSGNPDGRFWCEYEFMNLAPLTFLNDGLVERESVFLRRAAGNVSERLENFHPGNWFNLWEGIGRGGISAGFGTAQAARELYDPATWKNWTLDFDTLTLGGTLEVPFTLHWPVIDPDVLRAAVFSLHEVLPAAGERCALFLVHQQFTDARQRCARKRGAP